MAPRAGTDDVSDKERLKSALWYAIGKMVDHEALISGHNATPQFIGALTEMVWTHIENTSLDLENFAKHAGRSMVNTDDVLLLARRNEGLDALLRSFVDHIRAEHGSGGGSKRKS
ncbi:hypothetical protein P152DRAFT_459785 [Eremomyces bilateralis CBS 781.70]|uniref:Apoptosis-inducing TAF9-like domain 1 family protein n=1 Tax=Eremomyces bilateralis CBS 781.70 TaxID=1392243 RepID=A0A6G1G042_9PEZI|nr:uncharacterized protein P152DRAFT_459785 [Eremomyces bilateralis CBS 781.70]KAF1811388.1 hypothetical protein P152DRAFT_459785 [Eremomyces bilateralis CBS 781.70]